MLFEGPHRLPEMLADAAEVLGERQAVVARELTKMFETIRRGTLPELAAQLRRGGPAERRDRGADRRSDQGHAGRRNRCGARRQARGGAADHSIKDAAALVADELDMPKREVYARALALAEDEDA